MLLYPDDVGSPSVCVNMFYYNWLIKKLLWSAVGQNRAVGRGGTKMNTERKKAESEADVM